MRLFTNVADSEEKHVRIENSAQQLKELEDTSQFVYNLSSFSTYSGLNKLSHFLTDIISVSTKNSRYKNSFITSHSQFVQPSETGGKLRAITLIQTAPCSDDILIKTPFNINAPLISFVCGLTALYGSWLLSIKVDIHSRGVI